MRSILQGDDVYPYLSESCTERLAEIRYLARNSGILTNLVTQLSEIKYAVFPWIGTRQLYTLHFSLLQKGIKSRILWRMCVYLEVTFSKKQADPKGYLASLIREILASEADPFRLPLPDKVQIEHKYNEFIPLELLKKQFVLDFLDFDGLRSD